MPEEDPTRIELLTELAELRRRAATLEREQSRSEAILQKYEQRYRSFIEKTSDGIVLTDEQGNVIEWNDGQEQITGIKQVEALGRPIWEVQFELVSESAKSEEKRGKIVKTMKACLATGQAPWLNRPVEVTFQRADGALRVVQQQPFTIQTEKGFRLASINRDVTERRRAEEGLTASQEYAQSIIDCSLDMIITVDMDRHIIEFNQAAEKTFGYRREEVVGQHVDLLYAEPDEAPDVHQTVIEQGQCVREIFNKHKSGRVFPTFLSASILRNATGQQVGVMGISRDITARKQAEETVRQRNRDLELLNRAGQTFISTHDLDQMLATVLDEVRHQLGVVACSAWLVDPKTEDLVCRQVTDPQGELVRGWRLKPGQGLAGWVTRHGESLNVADVAEDARHFKQVDRTTGLPLRSILSVPLRVKEQVIGVLQAVDAEVGRFSDSDAKVLESLAATVAIAIENARLYEQASQDAETKAMLLSEVNHRVKNNLAAIIGLLYAERYHASDGDQKTYQAIIEDLIGRVQGLAMVHDLLSASKWTPVHLSELVDRVIHASLKSSPSHNYVIVDVPPSPIKVTPKQANNLALIVNELVTNTVKYALPFQETGRITARITNLDEDIRLEYRDNGPGYPQPVLALGHHNVGMYLIQTLVRQDLHGTLNLHNDQGAVAVIQFKPE